MSATSLFTPIKINHIVIPNRIAVAPMTRVTASVDGIASARMEQYYQSFARGKFGLVITEGIYIDALSSQTYSYQAGLINSDQAQAWKKITDGVHANGGKIFAQIQHSGALSQGNYYERGSVGPSSVQPKGEQMGGYRGEGQYPIPMELNEEEIHAIINSFAETAERAIKEAGFDGIEIHGANGYLLDQFFTDYTNLRSDKWGGDIAGRLTLSLEVIKAVRTRVGKDIPVGIRISQGKVNDFYHKWNEGEAGAKTVFNLLASSGIDYVHVTEFEALKPAFSNEGDSLVALARKYAPDLTIIANGNLQAPDKAASSLKDGADLISLGRGALANHDWPLRVKNGMSLREFNKEILGPIADIKDVELNNF